MFNANSQINYHSSKCLCKIHLPYCPTKFFIVVRFKTIFIYNVVYLSFHFSYTFQIVYIIWTSLVWWNFNNSLRKKLASVEKRIVLGVTNCRNFSAHAAVHVSKSYFTQCHVFFRTFWRNSVFWLLFAFSLFCCRSFFVVTCIVNWHKNEFFLWFCSKIVHRRALLVIIAPHVTYVHAFPALDLYLLQRFIWIKLNHSY